MPSWSQEEDEALQGLPHLCQVLYLRGLRSRMDYATGIVCPQHGLTWKRMSEVCEAESGGEGTHDPGESPTRKRIRWALIRLERAGLVKKLSGERFAGMRFFLPLAMTDRSVSDRRGQRGATTEGPHEKHVGSSGSRIRRGQRGATTEGPESVSPSISDLPLNPPRGGLARESGASVGEKGRRNSDAGSRRKGESMLDYVKRRNGRDPDQSG
jgi:hypothetical protein